MLMYLRSFSILVGLAEGSSSLSSLFFSLYYYFQKAVVCVRLREQSFAHTHTDYYSSSDQGPFSFSRLCLCVELPAGKPRTLTHSQGFDFFSLASLSLVLESRFFFTTRHSSTHTHTHQHRRSFKLLAIGKLGHMITWSLLILSGADPAWAQPLNR